MNNGLIAKLEGAGSVYLYTPTEDVQITAIGSKDAVVTVNDAVIFDGQANKSFTIVVGANQFTVFQLTNGTIGLISAKKV